MENVKHEIMLSKMSKDISKVIYQIGIKHSISYMIIANSRLADLKKEAY